MGICVRGIVAKCLSAQENHEAYECKYSYVEGTDSSEDEGDETGNRRFNHPLL
jgi:hypothetical protein